MDTDKMSATGMTLDGRKHTVILEHVVKFASWPTPDTMSGPHGPRGVSSNPKHQSAKGLEAVALASWPTPAASDDKMAGSGKTEWLPNRGNKGIRLNDQNAYVRYQLAQTIANGEMSLEAEGFYANGPGEKLNVFTMMDGSDNLLASKFNLSTQYRGLNGNPANAISFKAVFGDEDFKLEPDFGQRSSAVMSLDPTRVYFWKATWNNEFRLIVEQGRGGPRIYELAVSSRGSTYAPSPHTAFVGSSNGPIGEEAGSWPGVTYRNVWISSVPRPATLGNAVN